MVFGNFINKSLLLIIIKSTVQQKSVDYFICSGFCCCFKRIACAISSEFCFNSRHFQRSSVLCHWITSNCFLFSYWHLYATIISYFSIKSSRTNSLAARLLIERLCWSFFWKAFSVKLYVFERIQRHFFAILLLSWPSNRQFANDLFDSDFTTKSRIVVFVPPVGTLVRVPTDWIEKIEPQPRQIKLRRFAACIYFEIEWDYNSAFSNFVAVICA